MEIVNWDLISNPLNWVIVALMLLITVTALTYLQQTTGI